MPPEDVQHPDPTSPAPESPSSGTPAPTSTPDWASYLPQEYQSNPKAYFDKIQDDQQWATYGRAISPHHKTFESVQQQWNEFEAWRKTQGQPQAQPKPSPAAAMAEDDDESLDYGDPDTLKRVLRQLKQQVRGHVDSFGNELSLVRSEIKQGQDTLFELNRIQQELRDLRDDELFGHVKFQPRTNPHELAQYMLQHNIRDAKHAKELLYGPTTYSAQVKELEAKAQQMYEQGKADAAQELAKSRVTTDTSVGTPWRQRTEGRSTLPPGSQERRQEILDKAAARLGIPSEDVT
jgi:hypothetical protein